MRYIYRELAKKLLLAIFIRYAFHFLIIKRTKLFGTYNNSLADKKFVPRWLSVSNFINNGLLFKKNHGWIIQGLCFSNLFINANRHSSQMLGFLIFNIHPVIHLDFF